jgi:hypothetical protein
MKKVIKKITTLISEKLGIGEIGRMIAMERKLSISNYLNIHLFFNTKYSNSNRLNKYEYSIRSQDGSDGIINEIFNRIGSKNKKFVEFGVGDGLQNNTSALLLEGWSGLWFEGNKKNFSIIENNLHTYIDNNHLKVYQALINKENVEKLFSINGVEKNLDLLSIDIDGNDYWVWKSINTFKPRVLVIEYNPEYGSNISVIPEYNEDYFWKRTHFYGSSLKALNDLSKKKGYTLVACSFLGNNAFFVRDDLVNDKFDKQLTYKELYEEHKLFLLQESKYPKTFVNTISL